MALRPMQHLRLHGHVTAYHPAGTVRTMYVVGIMYVQCTYIIRTVPADNNILITMVQISNSDTYIKGGEQTIFITFQDFKMEGHAFDNHICAIQAQLTFYLGNAIVLRLQRRRRQRRVARRRTVWVKIWLLRRSLFGQYERLLQELNRKDERARYHNFLRVPQRLFMELVEGVGPHIQKKDTFWRK